MDEVPFQETSTQVHSSTPLPKVGKMVAQWITLDRQQAAQLFRSLVQPGACQYEQGRMRWWLQAGLRLELSDAGEWTLWVVPTRDCGAFRDSQAQKEG